MQDDLRDYSYDKNGNILNIDTNTEDNQYSYDNLDRIIGDTTTNNPLVNSTPINYNYDLNNNRLSKLLTDNSIDEQYQHQTNSNRITQVNALQTGVTPIDALPNRNMMYNNVGRLYQLVEDGTLKADYLYNDAGQRTRKTTYQADGITIDSITIYHYDQMGYLISETDETGQLIKDYIWQEGMTPLAQIDDNNSTETITYLHTDHLMTNRLATDQNQQVIWQWEGEAFGNTQAEEFTTTKVNLRFPGQYFDEETNLHYNHFRYYDPSLGRYITSDPIGLDGGINTYGYVGGNSVVSFDPLGLYVPTELPEKCQIVITSDNSIHKPKSIIGDPRILRRQIVTGGMKYKNYKIGYVARLFWEQVTWNYLIDIIDFSYYVSCKEKDECGREYTEDTPGGNHYEDNSERLKDDVKRWTEIVFGDADIPKRVR